MIFRALQKQSASGMRFRVFRRQAYCAFGGAKVASRQCVMREGPGPARVHGLPHAEGTCGRADQGKNETSHFSISSVARRGWILSERVCWERGRLVRQSARSASTLLF